MRTLVSIVLAALCLGVTVDLVHADKPHPPAAPAVAEQTPKTLPAKIEPAEFEHARLLMQAVTITRQTIELANATLRESLPLLEKQRQEQKECIARLMAKYHYSAEDLVADDGTIVRTGKPDKTAKK